MAAFCGTILRNTLIVMVKEPHPGRVKTRLGAGIGMVRAAWWYRHQVARLLRAVEDPRWELVLAVAPDAEGLGSRVWPAHLRRVAQGCGDLGCRMGRLLRGSGRVCIIGSDIPDVTAARVASAFKALGRADAVFGPCDDGGYWLVGMTRVPVRAFWGVRWSTEHALADTERSLGDLRIAHVDMLRDVDTVADL